MCTRGCLHCDILLWYSELLGLHNYVNIVIHDISETIYARNAGWFISCSTCGACRAHREECVVYVVRVAVLVPIWRTTKKQYSARVCKFSLLRSGFALILGTTYGKLSKVDIYLYSVYAVATPLNTCRACSACRARHDVLSRSGGFRGGRWRRPLPIGSYFSKSRFFRVKGIYFVVHICDKWGRTW